MSKQLRALNLLDLASMAHHLYEWWLALPFPSSQENCVWVMYKQVDKELKYRRIRRAFYAQ